MTRHGVTQTRTWNYDTTTQRLTSTVFPETGATMYDYNADGSLLRKTDARGYKVEYGYDGLMRVTSKTPKSPVGGTDSCHQVTYYYEATNPWDRGWSQNVQGRVSSVRHGYRCVAQDYHDVLETYSYSTSGLVTAKRLRVLRGGVTAYREASYSYDNKGRMLNDGGVALTYDSMGRPYSGAGVQALTYSEADLPSRIDYAGYYEERTYNSLRQLVSQSYKQAGTGSVLAGFTYTFPTGTNNGRISTFSDGVTGETVNYQYDALNRLISASTSDASWGESLSYDGFGNLQAETVTKGSAPNYNLVHDYATNRVVAPAGFAYDTAGNMTAMPGKTMTYDAEGRMTYSRDNTLGEEWYRYLDRGQRLTKGTGANREVYFYNPGGQLRGALRYTFSGPPGFQTFTVEVLKSYVYFAGRRMEPGRLTDRLGTVRATTGGQRYSYFPYGQERAVTGNDQYKFGTYYRDGKSGLDYAEMRYYASGWGRLLTPDPYKRTEANESSGNWNQYGYVIGDPVNYFDAMGMDAILSGVAGDQGGTPYTFTVTGYAFAPITFTGTGSPGAWAWGSKSSAGSNRMGTESAFGGKGSSRVS